MSLVAGKLKYQRGLERLEKTNISKEEIEEPLNYIQNKKGDQFSCMESLSRGFLQLSSKNLLIEKNIKEHRLNCYIGGKLQILGCDRDSRLFTQTSQMFEMFMSNNPDFITFFKNNIDMIMPDDYDSEKNKYGYLKNDYGTFF